MLIAGAITGTAQAQVIADSFIVEPTYKEASFNVDKGIWLKRNWGYIFALFIIVMFGAILLYALRGR
jgi:hypothetical protein